MSRTDDDAGAEQFATIDDRTFDTAVELSVGKIYRFPFPKYLSKFDIDMNPELHEKSTKRLGRIAFGTFSRTVPI